MDSGQSSFVLCLGDMRGEGLIDRGVWEAELI
jgi:hypothetical protein